MPELPEVESYRRYFDQTAHQQMVKKAEVIDAKVVKMAPEVLQQAVEGRVLGQSDRIGKYMFVHLGGGGVLMLYFGMTGSLEYVADQAELPRFTRVRFWLANGLVWLLSNPANLAGLSLGPVWPSSSRAKPFPPTRSRFRWQNGGAVLSKHICG